MDPVQLDAAQWAETRAVIAYLWLCVLSAIVSAASFWVAHAIIPSQLGTGDISASRARLRPLFYVLGFAGLVAIVIFVVLIALNLSWLGETFPRYFQ